MGLTFNGLHGAASQNVQVAFRTLFNSFISPDVVFSCDAVKTNCGDGI
jgi:hypothetical protein